VRQCGWTTERFQIWLAAALTTLALSPRGHPASGWANRWMSRLIA